jgi:tetratricopeptide (TPR) repeat protein
MRRSIAQWLRSPLTAMVLVRGFLALIAISRLPASPQSVPLPNTPGAPASDITNIPKPVLETMDEVDVRNAATRDAAVQGKKVSEREAACLFPPLSLIPRPVISVEELQQTAKARNEYWQGCLVLKKKRNADAEQHFRKAVRQYPKYGTAWVTLGQLLVKEQRVDEGRQACARAAAEVPSYALADLCLADIAAIQHSWREVLALSERVLAKECSLNFVAYEYNAAANLNLHNLSPAEKSGLRAAELDREHREPRVHFVLAQIYEAKGEPANEAAQLREYLKYTDSPADAALVEQFLVKLEQQTKLQQRPEAAEASDEGDWVADRWAPADIDANVPRVVSDGSVCPLPQILQEASRHTLELIESMRRLSASEQIEQINIDRKGKRHTSGTEVTNYVAEIEQNSGYPSIREYRAGASGIRGPRFIDTGAAVFALIFHPSHVGDFEFRCEGLSDLQGTAAWQVHFVEGDDPNKAFTAITRGTSIHLPRLKGRAWISAAGYNILRIETDLVNPIPKLDLRREHQVITYAPVEFPAKHIRLWLPDSSSIYIASRRRHYERVHRYAEFQLFSVDSTEAVKEPPANKVAQYFSRI